MTANPGVTPVFARRSATRVLHSRRMLAATCLPSIIFAAMLSYYRIPGHIGVEAPNDTTVGAQVSGLAWRLPLPGRIRLRDRPHQSGAGGGWGRATTPLLGRGPSFSAR